MSAAPFGALFGALAVDHGLTAGEAVLMSVTVYAGASQMVGLNLFRDNAAAWLIVFSIFAVNFRHVLYSASLGRHLRHFGFAQKIFAYFLLVDPVYAASEMRVEKRRPLGFAWYLGMGIPVYVVWNLMTLAGALFGRLISEPERYGIDFLLPIYFLGLLLGFRRRANWLPVVLASGVGSILAFLYVGSPWHVSLGALAGILVAVLLPPGKAANDPVPGEDRPEGVI
nr:AzlC family ABC transporter permease [Pseudohoeflea sp. DP4N28-3]